MRAADNLLALSLPIDQIISQDCLRVPTSLASLNLTPGRQTLMNSAPPASSTRWIASDFGVSELTSKAMTTQRGTTASFASPA